MWFFVYLLASKPYGTLYAGYTDDIVARIGQHRAKTKPHGFTAKYGVTRLVWYERHGTRHEAWTRERRIKEWRREWKVRLIEEQNPHWLDLYPSILPPIA